MTTQRTKQRRERRRRQQKNYHMAGWVAGLEELQHAVFSSIFFRPITGLPRTYASARDFCRLLHVCREWRTFGLRTLRREFVPKVPALHWLLSYEKPIHGGDPYMTTNSQVWLLLYQLAEWWNKRLVSLSPACDGLFVGRACAFRMSNGRLDFSSHQTRPIKKYWSVYRVIVQNGVIYLQPPNSSMLHSIRGSFLKSDAHWMILEEEDFAPSLLQKTPILESFPDETTYRLLQ